MTKKSHQKKSPARKRSPPRRPPLSDAHKAFLRDFCPPPKVLRRGPRPDPRQWHSELPELLACPLLKHEFDQVVECMSAIAPIQARGTTVAMKMEFAAALLAAACAAAYESASAQGEPADGPARFSSAEDLIVRRARELYGQGRA